MPRKEQETAGPGMTASASPDRNPHILNFCRALVERRGEKLAPEALKKLINDMYGLFECMLGQNMIAALPEDIRTEYLALSRDLSRLSYEKIAGIFDRNVPDYEHVMKETMKQFAEVFLKNRPVKSEDYPACAESPLIH